MLKLVSFYNLLVSCQVGGLPPNLCLKNAVFAEGGEIDLGGGDKVTIEAGQALSDAEIFWLERTFADLIFDHWWKHGGNIAALKAKKSKEQCKDLHDKKTA